jgi:hypothetical protein
MSNMSYCRFQNTLADLRDCEEALGEDQLRLSDEEKRAAVKLIKTCKRIADDYGTED